VPPRRGRFCQSAGSRWYGPTYAAQSDRSARRARRCQGTAPHRVAHCNSSRWLPSVAARQVSAFRGQPSLRAHFSTSRRPGPAAAEHPQSAQGGEHHLRSLQPNRPQEYGRSRRGARAHYADVAVAGLAPRAAAGVQAWGSIAFGKSIPEAVAFNARGTSYMERDRECQGRPRRRGVEGARADGVLRVGVARRRMTSGRSP
jgi:hypothetical protein